MAYGQVSVGATAVLIVPANNNRRGLIIDNQGSVTLFFGTDASITTSNTVSLRASQTLVVDDHFVRLAIYGIVASSTATIGWLEVTG